MKYVIIFPKEKNHSLSDGILNNPLTLLQRNDSHLRVNTLVTLLKETNVRLDTEKSLRQVSVFN